MPEKNTVLENIYKNKYFKVSAFLKQEKAQNIIAIVLTLIALSFFGLFAISPTLSTIVNLRKQLDDDKLVDERLEKKITNLSLLQQKYALLQDGLGVVFSAIPQNPSAPFLLGQMQNIAKESDVKINRLQSYEVELNKKDEGIEKYSSFGYFVEVEGTFQNLLNFMNYLSGFERIVDIDTISLGKSNKEDGGLILGIKGTTYFKK